MTSAQTDRAHATLAPSAAHRFTHCPGSHVLEAMMPEGKSSAAANEGTAAHELGAWALEQNKDPGDMLGRVIDITGKDHMTRFLVKGSPLDGDTRWTVTDEMVEAVQMYVDHVRNGDGGLWVEQKLEMTHIHPDIWGTGDAIKISSGHLRIVDLKYGRGVVVEARDNPQLLLYAAGAVRRFDNHQITKVTMTIVQPRAPHKDGPIRSWTLDLADFDREVNELASAAVLVDAAKAQRPNMDAARWNESYLAAGDWCRFCAAGAICPKRRDHMIAEAQAEFAEDGTMTLPEPDKMSADELAKLLTVARQMQHWVRAVEEHANAEALAGRMPTGFKLVEGRSNRVWINEDALKAAAPMLLSVDLKDLYEEPQPPKLLSPAKFEKLVPKDERAALKAFITKPPGSLNLVPEDDARPAARMTAEQEFAE